MELLRIIKNQEFWKLRSLGIYRSFLTDYKKCRKMSLLKIISIHRKGFLVNDWRVLGLSKDNAHTYLTSKEYRGMHPLNGQYSYWIDDKLTLKYMCAGTILDQYMPEYYYEIDSKGRVLCLMDSRVKKPNATAEDVADCLEEKRMLAIKLTKGAIGKGFYRAEYDGGVFSLNGEKMQRGEFCERIAGLRNYLITEYLRPHPQFAAMSAGTTNTIRYLMGRIDGEMKMLKGFVRFGTKQSGYVENFNRGGVLCYIEEDGSYNGGYMLNVKSGNAYPVAQHPDTNTDLVGKIPHWDVIQKACGEFDRHFPQMNYLGMDFVVTDDGRVKILEINSLTSLDSLQLDYSILESKNGRFFKERVQRKR